MDKIIQPTPVIQLPALKVFHSILFFVYMLLLNIVLSIIFGIFAGIYAMVVMGLKINEMMDFVKNLMINGNIVVLITLLYYIIVLLSMYLLVRLLKLVPREIFALRKVDSYRWSLLLLLSFVLIVLAMGISFAFEELGKQTFMYQILTSGKGLISLFAFMVLGAPIIEELVFRGFLYSPFETKWGKGPAILIITGIFAFFHLFQLLGSLVLLIPIIALGLVTTWLRSSSQSILPGFMVHTIYNTVLISLSLTELIQTLD